MMRRDQGVKDRIQVDINQIVEVLQIGTSDRIDCLIRVGAGIQIGLE